MSQTLSLSLSLSLSPSLSLSLTLPHSLSPYLSPPSFIPHSSSTLPLLAPSVPQVTPTPLSAVSNTSNLPLMDKKFLQAVVKKLKAQSKA
jgi:hypothetical protein